MFNWNVFAKEESKERKDGNRVMRGEQWQEGNSEHADLSMQGMQHNQRMRSSKKVGTNLSERNAIYWWLA